MLKTLRPVMGKTQNEITKEWSKIAKFRVSQIKKGIDLSFSYILVPCIFELSEQSDFTSVIDIGCGVGFLSKALANKAQRVIGIDTSRENIEIARKLFGNIANAEFVNSAIQDYIPEVGEKSCTLAILNMTLMTTLDLNEVLKSTACILKPAAHLVFTITHPCFWPLYWEYAFENWFNYKKEIPIEAEFKISLQKRSGLITTHIHRPLEHYISCLIKAGFIIDQISEPFPDSETEEKYPKRWQYPRFLGIRCIRL